MSLSYYTQDPKELFNILLDLREFSSLWLEVRLKARRGESAKAEKQRLGELIEKLAERLEILPFRGRLIKHLISRRPTILPKWTGAPETVDKTLSILTEYLTYRCDHAVWHDISQNPTNIDEYLKRGDKEEKNGLMFEIIVRRWLKEIINKHWVNVESLVVPIKPNNGYHSIEIDAFSLTRQKEYHVAAVAEVKWRLHLLLSKEPVDAGGRPLIPKFTNNIQELSHHFSKWLGISLTYKEIALVTGSSIEFQDKTHIIDKLSTTLSQKNIHTEHVNLYDMNDIWNSVKDTAHPIRNVIHHIFGKLGS